MVAEVATQRLQEERQEGSRQDSRFGHCRQRIDQERLCHRRKHKQQRSYQIGPEEKKMINYHQNLSQECHPFIKRVLRQFPTQSEN